MARSVLRYPSMRLDFPRLRDHRSAQTRASQWSLRLAAVLFMLSIVATPVTSSTDDGISNSELFEKSLYAAEQALSFYGAWDAPEEMERIASIGYAIGQQTDFDSFPFSFYLIDMPEPNAFALPGGQIFMTRGMIQLGLDDDMLAGLLGHEIGHVVLLHGTRLERRARLLNVLSQALLVGVVVSTENNRDDRAPVSVYDPTRSSDNRGDIVQGTAAAGLVLTELLLRSYSREFEDEADEEGLRLAAAAGYAPDGTARLMAKMQTRLPESRDYGYWRTHPFFRDRVRAASARQEGIKTQPPSDTEEYRKRTQTILLDYATNAKKLEEEAIPMLKRAGLSAWPQGPRAEALRLERLRELRDGTTELAELARDYGVLLEAYRQEREVVADLTPESEFLATLDEEIASLDSDRAAVYPNAKKVFAGTIYETDFLRVFLSNYPDAPERPQVALTLGDAYSRLRRPADAVSSYLTARTADPSGEIGDRAERGLKVLAPSLEDLSALQELALEGDAELREAASQRLTEQVSQFDELANGAAYLRTYPDGEHVEAVTSRLNSVAERLHGELLLYQQVGDQVKALARIQQILTEAPHSPAAERIREKAIFDT